MNDAKIGEKKNMNLPGIKINLPTLTEQDEKDIIDFGLKYNIDIIAASFIRKASDVEYIRDVLGVKGATIKIVSKIENQEGLENFEEILAASDGIMVSWKFIFKHHINLYSNLHKVVYLCILN